MQNFCMLFLMKGGAGMRQFAWVIVLSVVSVLVIYLAGVWFDTLIPE